MFEEAASYPVRLPVHSSDIQLRKYRRDDLEAIVALDALCFEPLFRFTRSAMRRFAEAEDAWTRLAIVNGKLAGFIIVHREEIPAAEAGYVVTIDVAQKYRQQGIGRLMLQAAEEAFATSGTTAMLLHVYTKNQEAISFYERNGYQRGDEQTGFYGPGMDAALYWKELFR